MLNSSMQKNSQDNRHSPKRHLNCLQLQTIKFIHDLGISNTILPSHCRSLIEALSGSPFDLIAWETHLFFRHVRTWV